MASDLKAKELEKELAQKTKENEKSAAELAKLKEDMEAQEQALKELLEAKNTLEKEKGDADEKTKALEQKEQERAEEIKKMNANISAFTKELKENQVKLQTPADLVLEAPNNFDGGKDVQFIVHAFGVFLREVLMSEEVDVVPKVPL